MVAKMMRWRPWPPLLTKKYEVRLLVRRLEGCDWVRAGAEKGQEAEVLSSSLMGAEGVSVEIKWKGPRIALSSLRRTVRRNFTREELPVSNGVVLWDEEFQSVCNLSAYKDSAFHPWEIAFTVLNGFKHGPRSKVPAVGVASLNLAEFASKGEEKEFEVNLPLTMSVAGAEPRPALSILLSLLELRTAPEPAEFVQRPVPSPPQSEPITTEKDELSAIKAGLKKVKIFTDYVSTRRAKKTCRDGEGSEGRSSSRSEDGEYTSPFDSDSLDDFEEGETDDGKDEPSIRKSFSYGPLAFANWFGGSFHSNTRITSGDEDWIYYSNRKSDVGCLPVEDSAVSVSEPPLMQTSKRSILSWRKRKLSFRSPKAKGEPLLKKAYAEEGGDDIDFDRRQLSSDESLLLGVRRTDEDSVANRSSASEFGDDNFAVGSWELKEVVSRDGHLKLQTQVFFASIDQRSERAAGESACTALVAVIADWFQSNRDLLPIKSQFDSLIREGSLEWRNLCENDTYRERFPDKHFDLETVLQAKIRSLSVAPAKSFIGFFHPEGLDEDRFEFLHGAMSFDGIWDEISHAESESSCDCEPQVYIVSWNDHFFVLKVEPEAYYIIDTLGERLFEGCNQAYILKFDRNTKIHKVADATQSADEKQAADQQIAVAAGSKSPHSRQIEPKEGSVAGAVVSRPGELMNNEEVEEVMCQGKESCKEYIKNFLAAIPIRELQADIKRGLMSTPLHHRLQIEFHYTRFLEPVPEILTIEGATDSLLTADSAITDGAA